MDEDSASVNAGGGGPHRSGRGAARAVSALKLVGRQAETGRLLALLAIAHQGSGSGQVVLLTGPVQLTSSVRVCKWTCAGERLA